MSYNPQPPAGSFLYAVEVPPAGGDTGFLNLYRAYETLPAALKAAIDGGVDVPGAGLAIGRHSLRRS